MTAVSARRLPDRPVIRLLPGRDNRARHGYPWIFANEIAMDATVKAIPPGEIVRVITDQGRQLGLAGFNRHALIAARLLTGDPAAAIDRDFLAAVLQRALALRERLFPEPFYRLTHAEADGLPGAVIDRYGDHLVVQCNTAVMDRLLPELLSAIDAVIAPAAVVLRNDGGGRTMEGLDSAVAVAAGRLDGPVAIMENGCRFQADLLGGQKTGWFYDQRDNRAFAQRLAAGGRRVLDVYSHTGGFAIQAAAAGAASVLAVDRSAGALDLAAASAALNPAAAPIDWRKAEAFAEMERLAQAGERFELVVVDPPAFVKTRKDLGAGQRGYRKMVRLAAPLVAPGGALVACSCSHHLDPAGFADQVRRGLVDARRTGRVIREAGAAPDHPVHPLLPETRYLKALFLVLD